MNSRGRAWRYVAIALVAALLVGGGYAVRSGWLLSDKDDGQLPAESAGGVVAASTAFRPWLETAPSFAASLYKADGELAFPKDYADKWVWLMFASKG